MSTTPFEIRRLGPNETYVGMFMDSATSDPLFTKTFVSDDIEKVVDSIHMCAESYDFSVSADGQVVDGDGSTDMIDWAETLNGKIAMFMHAGGDGPVAYIVVGRKA